MALSTIFQLYMYFESNTVSYYFDTRGPWATMAHLSEQL